MNFPAIACLFHAVLTMIVALSVLPTAASAAREKVAVVRVSTARLRSAPSEDKRAIGLLDRGDSLAVVGQSGGWVKIQSSSGRVGWVRSDLVRVKYAPKITEKPRASVRVPAATTPKSSGTPTRVAKQRGSRKQLSATASAKSAKPTKIVEVGRPLKTDATSSGSVGPGRSSDSVPESVKAAVVPSVPAQALVDDGGDAADFLPMVAETEVALETPVDRIGRARVSLVEDALSVYRQENSVNRSSSSRTALVSRAKSLRGTPYRFGSTGRGSFDCSGFTQHLYRRQGLQIPRTASEQFHHGVAIGRMSLRQGDLVFFRNTGGRRGISHVGMFLGSGRFIHASSRGGGVRIDSLTEAYYASHYAGARRVLR